MLVSIKVREYDLDGAIILDADVGDSDLKEYTRRVNRVKTLDQNAVIIDNGFSHADRTLSIVAHHLSDHEVSKLRYINQNYDQIEISVPDGIYLANLQTVKDNGGGDVTLTVLIESALATVNEYVSVSTTTSISSTSTTTTTGSTVSTESTTSSTASTESTQSTQSTTSSTASTESTVSTQSTTSSTASTESTVSTQSTTTSTNTTGTTESTQSTTTSTETTTSTTTTETATTSTVSTVTTDTTVSTTTSTVSTESTQSTTTSTGTTESTTSSTASTESTQSTTTSTNTTVTTDTTESTQSTTSSTASTESTQSTTSSTTTTSPCQYDESFTTLNTDEWLIGTKSGNETVAINDGKLKLTIPDEDSNITMYYKYEIPSGDFEIVIDVTDYHTTDTAYAVTPSLIVTDRHNVKDDYARLELRHDGSDYMVKSRIVKNGSADEVTWETSSGMPTALKITREGSEIKTYWYDGSWNLSNTLDLLEYASNIKHGIMYTLGANIVNI